MSKFTKALEKIQEDKTERVQPLGGKSPFSFEMTEPANDKFSEWRRGIPVVKHSQPDPDVVAHHFSSSIVAEQYRMLRTNIKNSFQKKEGAKVVLISSSIHSEGKTITSANLALSLAEDKDIRVALIDADLRKGRLAECLGFGKGRYGLSNYLMDDEANSPKKAMVRNSLENFVLIPRGSHSHNPSQLISSNKFKLLLAQLRNGFDYIIIDAPPIMAAADAGIMGREADGVVMIIQLGRTPKNIITHSNMLFKQSGIKLMGYVLTNVEYSHDQYKYYYGYYFSDEEQKVLADLKKKSRITMKKVGEELQHFEERFNVWWGEQAAKRSKRIREKAEKKNLEKLELEKKEEIAQS